MIFAKLSPFFCIIFAGIFLLISSESVGQIRIREVSKSLTGTAVNSVASTVRTETYTVLWSGEDFLPTTDNTFIGIRSLSFVSQTVDFTVEWSSAAYTSDAASVNYQIIAGPNCDIELIEHFVLMTADPRVILINYDFSSDPSFASTFSTVTDSDLTYTVPYTSAFPDLFLTGATAYVSFTRVKFAQTCITYKFDYEIIQITSSSVKLKIRKFDNTILEALKGQILIISSDATSSLGFKSTTITTSAFAAGGTVGNLITGTLTSITAYYGAPEMLFTLKKFNFENLINFQTEGELSIDSNNFKPTLAVTQVGTSVIQGLKYTVLTFCKKGNDCKRPGFQPSVVAGESKIQTFTGMSPGTATAAERAINFNIAFSRFLTSTPTNFAVAILAGDTTSGFCTRVLGITQYSIQIEIRAFANLAISKLKVSYIASLWDGFQIISTDFADSGQLAATNGMALRTFLQDIFYTTSADISSMPSAYTIFSEVEVAIPGSAYRMDSTKLTHQTSTEPFSVNMRQAVTGTLVFNKLKGFVIVTDSSFMAANQIGPKSQSMTGTTPVDVTTQLNPSVYYAYVPIIFNFIKSFILPCGALKTGAGQYFNDYFLAGSTCKIMWHYGIDNTCASATIGYNLFSFPSYSSSGFDYSLILGSGTICLEASFGGGEEYAVVVTDDAEWNGKFTFTREIRTIPRVVQNYIPTVSLSGTLGMLQFPPPTIGESGFYTYHLIQSASNSAWQMAGLTSDYMHDFHDTSSAEIPETATGTFGYSGADLSQPINKYTTLVATQFITYDQLTDFSCTVRITFKGVIRALYVDSKFILAGSSVDSTASVTIDSEVSADFVSNAASASSAATITIFGSYLRVASLDFVNCLDSSSISITPTFNTYIPASGSNADSRVFYESTTSVTCGSGCKSCKDSSVCYECLDNYFLLGSICVSSCNDPTYFVAAKNRFCRSQFPSLGLKLSPTSYNKGTIALDIQVNPFEKSYGALTMVYPKAITATSYPLIIDDNTKPFALVEGPNVGTMTSRAVEQVFSISKKINVNNIAIALNNEVKLITFTIYRNYFLFLTVLNAGPNFIDSSQNTAYGTPVTSITISDNYQVHVIVNAPSGGDLSIEFKGQLEVILNQVTVIFSATFTTQKLYTLDKPLPTGLSYLTFKGSGTDYFDFSVSGSRIKIYSPTSFLYEETLTIPVSSSLATTIEHCYNGAGSTCNSCLAPYYLSPDNSQCTSDCRDFDLLNIDEERICKIPPVPEAIKILQKVYQTRQISNEVFSIVSSLVAQGIHSIRSQTLQSPLGYFMFINIKFPLNYIQYAANNQDFWENPENTPVETNDTDEQSNIDAYIEDQDIGANIGQTLIYLAACVLIIPIYEGIVWLLRGKSEATPQNKWYHKILVKGSVSLRWSFLMNQFLSKYQDVAFFVFLGIYNAGRGDKTDAGNTSASVIGFIFVVFILVGLFFILRSISKEFKNYKEEEIEKKKYKENEYLNRRKILFKDLKKDKFISLLYTFLVILRIFGFCFSVIFIGCVVGIQLAFLNISSWLILFYLLYFKPFDEPGQLRLTLVYEIDFYVGVLAATILQIYIAAGGDDKYTKYGFGYAIIAADIGMIVLNFISFYLEMREYTEILYSYLKLTYQKKKNRKLTKVSPEAISRGDSPSKTDDDASPERKRFKFDNRDPSPSTPETVFASSFNDPKRPSWKDQTRQSLLRTQPLSIIEHKEESDNLMSFSEVKSPNNDNLKVDALSLSPENKDRLNKSARKSHFSISPDKEITEVRLNEDGEISKLI